MTAPDIRVLPSWPLTDEQRLRLDADAVRPILPQLLDSLTDAVLIVDRSFNVIAANRRYLEAFGAQRADLVGGICKHALHCPLGKETEGDEPCAGCSVIEDRAPRQFIRSLPDPQGSPHRWEVTLSPVLNGAGVVTHVVEVWRDISDRGKLEMQLSHSERLASLGILAAGVAHEINNPLASIIAGIAGIQRSFARAKGLDAPTLMEVAEVIEALETAAERCRETTEKLLLLAQPIRVAPCWVDMNRAVRDTLSLLAYQARKQNVESVADLDPDLPSVWAREGGIRGICMNLGMNAVQAMPKGGKVTMRTRRTHNGVTLVVEDTGPGIPPEHFDRIWDPFFTTKPTGQGTGLGLSITQRVVERHGGRIRVENLEGAGARFVVDLPLAGAGGSGG